MKKLFYPIMGLAIMFIACKKEVSVDMNDKASSTIMKLSVRGDRKDNLFIQDDKGLKSSALTYVSYVSPGDTMIWRLNDGSNILSIEDIIIVSSECEQFFENGLVFNTDKTECYAIVSIDAFGRMKYDIKYKFIDGSEVIVDPDAEIDPPSEPSEQTKK